jgi:1,4-alpha-glucan branching enzyme
MKNNKPSHASTSAPAAERIQFTYIHSTATNVSIAGTFNLWRPEVTPMISLGNGRWMKEIVLRPGTYEYCLVVDGVWTPDPQAEKCIPNPFGGLNSVLNVPSAPPQGSIS